jgi:hypothetical protein
VWLTGIAALSLSLAVGQAIRLDNPILQRAALISCWAYLGLWAFVGLRLLESPDQTRIALMGIFIFLLSAAIWSSHLKTRLSLPSPTLALELYLYSVNLLIAGWVLWGAQH